MGTETKNLGTEVKLFYQHTIHTQIGTLRFRKKYLVKMGTKCECLIPWTTAIVICETNLTDN